LIRWCI